MQTFLPQICIALGAVLLKLLAKLPLFHEWVLFHKTTVCVVQIISISDHIYSVGMYNFQVLIFLEEM